MPPVCEVMALGARTPLTISIGGGKGGVGKSVVAANLGIAMARVGFRVILVDADLGSANQHTLFGVERPGHTLQAFIDRKIGSLEEAVVPTHQSRLFLLPGTTGVANAANVGHAQKLKLIRHLQALESDVVLVDCGAGSSFNVLDFYDLADVRVVVTTPQLTALQNAYGFLKSAVYRSLRQCALTAGEQQALDNATTHCETERIDQVLARITKKAQPFATSLVRYLENFGGRLVGNQLEHPGQARTLHAFTRMAKDFLGLDVPFLGALPADRRIHASVTRRRPLLLDETSGPIAQAFSDLAEQLLTTDSVRLREGRRRHDSEPPPNGRRPGPMANFVRRHPRAETSLPARVISSGRNARAELLDVSDSGMRIATLIPVAVGARVVVRLDPAAGGHAFAAKVRWVRRGQIGVELTDASKASELMNVAKQRLANVS